MQTMQSLINKGKIEMPSSDQDSSSMNGSGTGPKIDTPLTHSSSRDVPAGLIQMRRAHGHTSKVGRRCSSILEMMDAGTAKPADIADQVRQLAKLTS